MNIDKAIADLIGSLTLTNIKHAATIDALKVELARKDAIIRQLNEAAKDAVPVPLPAKKGANGAKAHEHH